MATMDNRLMTERKMMQSQHHQDSTAATVTTQMTINMWQGCEVWALSLMPLGAVVVVEKERRMTAKMFQGLGGGGGGGERNNGGALNL